MYKVKTKYYYLASANILSLTYLYTYSLAMASSSENEVEIYNEQEIIRYYFNAGFEYNVILLFLKKYHDIEMSRRTLRTQS